MTPDARPAPPPPLSLTRPLPTGAEMGAAIAYLDWLGSELTAGAPRGTPLEAFGCLILAAVGAVRGSVFRARHAALMELAFMAAEWAGRQPSRAAGLTIVEARDAGLIARNADPSAN